MNDVLDIILRQKQELEYRQNSEYTQRDSYIRDLDNGIIKVVIGPRRSGKSFFCSKVIIGKNYAYLNFDDETLIRSDFNSILSTLRGVYRETKNIFIDEIQNYPRWELIANRLQREGYNLLITGSNANLLSSELSTHLTGRYLRTVMMPFSYKEIFNSNNPKTIEEMDLLEMKYLNQGGYPEVVVRNVDFKDYLSTLFEATIYKDVVRRYKLRNSLIEELAIYLFTNITKKYSYNTLSGLTNTKSSNTIKKYISYLENSMLLFTISKYDTKVKEIIKSNRKVYAYDNGMINAISNKNSSDLGRLYENAIAIKLQRDVLDLKIKLYYYEDNNSDIDFLVKRGTDIELVQVCYDITDASTYNREIKSLINASKKLKSDNLILINKSINETREVSWFGTKKTIKLIALKDYLMDR